MPAGARDGRRDPLVDRWQPFTFAATVMIPKGTLLLPAPYPDEGVDPTEDSLGCERS